MCKSTKWEISSECTFIRFDKVLPHKSSSCIFREWEIYGSLKEFLEFFLRSLFRFRCATNNCDSCLIIYKFGLPLQHCFFNSSWIRRVWFLLFCSFSFLSFFLCRPNFLTFININYRWLIFSCSNHHRSNKFFFFLFTCILSINIDWTHIK